MPELPEVETIVCALDKASRGSRIVNAQVLTKKIRVAVPKNIDLSLKNRLILKVDRRAKYILIHLDSAEVLIIHLGMSGRINIAEKGQKRVRLKHDHFVVELSNGKEISFNDPRRFGLIAFTRKETLGKNSLFSHLGPEPLEKEFNAEYLFEKFSKRKTAVKIVLMNQEIVVGVGNIYASEALFDARIDPHRNANTLAFDEVKQLVVSVRKTLKAAIKAGGSTLKDYRKINGELGYFQHKFSVYDRAGKACKECTCDVDKTGGVQKSVQGGRSTFYCPRKQL